MGILNWRFWLLKEKRSRINKRRNDLYSRTILKIWIYTYMYALAVWLSPSESLVKSYNRELLDCLSRFIQVIDRLMCNIKSIDFNTRYPCIMYYMYIVRSSWIKDCTVLYMFLDKWPSIHLFQTTQNLYPVRFHTVFS